VAYNWVRDPKHYSPATYMPTLRLTDAQIADVATYLTTLKAWRATRRRPHPIRRPQTLCCSIT
jgi:cytochrome c1